jgi:hypothetical protein
VGLGRDREAGYRDAIDRRHENKVQALWYTHTCRNSGKQRSSNMVRIWLQRRHTIGRTKTENAGIERERERERG